MGIMKHQQQQHQQIEQQTNASKINNRNNNIDKKPTTTTTTTGNLSKQNKTLHNQQLLKECHQDEQSKIPVIRATARLLDFATTNTLVGSSATIPPIRNNMRLQHHMLLRGRSRIRHHRRNMGVGVGVGVPTTYATNNNNEGRSISANLDTYTNALPQKEMLGLRFSAPCNKNSNNSNTNNNIIISSLKQKNNNTNNTTTISSNNANDDPTLSDNSYSISSSITSSITRPVIRRRFNANLSSTDTNLLNSQSTSGTKNLDDISRTSTSPSSSTSSLVLDDNTSCNNNANNNNSSSSAGSCCTTVSAIKRNKRSLSSTRIEKDKCDEYNTKLLRKTTPPMGHYANKKTNQISNNNNNNNTNVDINKQDVKKLTTSKTRTHNSCQDMRSMTNKESATSRGGSFKEYSTTSGIPTPIGGLHQRPSHYQLSTK